MNSNLLSILNPNFVLVALNISRGDITTAFANFHDARPEATDFKIRYAIKNTPLWGAYMTDIIKDFDEKISGKVVKYLKENIDLENENANFFLEEISDIGSQNPTLIAFGNDTFNILNRKFANRFKILKVSNYANYTGKEKYREQVHSMINQI